MTRQAISTTIVVELFSVKESHSINLLSDVKI